jgi:hypothetical protein
MSTDIYKEMVWDLFLTVVRETPQWSGKAVANWNISIGSLGAEYDDNLGDDDFDVVPTGSILKVIAPHHKGDTQWERVAWNRNRPIVKSIKLNDQVFIYNWTAGDEGYSYMEGFQKSEGWPTKLRAVNRPYETVCQSVQIVTRRWATKGFNFNTTRRDRVGGGTLE